MPRKYIKKSGETNLSEIARRIGVTPSYVLAVKNRAAKTARRTGARDEIERALDIGQSAHSQAWSDSIDPSTIPDEVIVSENARRNAAKRTKFAGGRPQKPRCQCGAMTTDAADKRGHFCGRESGPAEVVARPA